MVQAIVNDANSPMRGSTPAMIENEMASGMSARATTSPASTSVLSRRGSRSAASVEVSRSPASGTRGKPRSPPRVSAALGVVLAKDGSVHEKGRSVKPAAAG